MKIEINYLTVPMINFILIILGWGYRMDIQQNIL